MVGSSHVYDLSAVRREGQREGGRKVTKEEQLGGGSCSVACCIVVLYCEFMWCHCALSVSLSLSLSLSPIYCRLSQEEQRR